MIRALRVAIAAATPLLVASGVHAETRFRGMPLPECRSFWITETGAAIGKGDFHDAYITWELGHMVNISPRLALGGTFLTAYDTEDARIGAKARARWWLGPKWSLEASPGVILYDHRFPSKTPGFGAHVGLNYGDWVALTGQVELEGRVKPGRYVGLKAGSYPGLAGFAISIVAAVIGLAAYQVAS